MIIDLDLNTDTDAQDYAAGRAAGFLAATLGGFHTDALADAEASWCAAPYSLAQARARASMLPVRSLHGTTRAAMMRHCGVLYGYKVSTEDRPDAAECVVCERRLFLDTTPETAVCPNHGVLHDECRASVCLPGITNGCWSE